jgi:hypothetical protein
MTDKMKLLNALNFVRSELAKELVPKMDKHYKNFDKIELLEKLLNKLQ